MKVIVRPRQVTLVTSRRGDPGAASITEAEVQALIDIEKGRAETAETELADRATLFADEIADLATGDSTLSAALAAEAALARNADNLTSGIVADARVASTIARDSEVAAVVAAEAAARDTAIGLAVAAEAALARNADNLTSGNVADARIPASIARGSEVDAAIAAEASARDAAISTALNNLVSAAPGTLDTLDELAAALGDDPNFAATVTTSLAAKVSASLYDANTILVANVDDTPVALAVAASTLVGRKASGNIAAMTAAEAKTVLAITESDVAGLTADLAALVPKSLYDANTILVANVDDTPLALAIGASTFVGRKAAGGIAAMTAAEAKTILAIAESDVSGLVADLALKAPLASPTFSGTVTLGDAVNIALGTATGTKIGTATTQKLGFFNAAPVAQIAGNVDVLAGMVTLGLRAASSNPPLNLGSGALTSGTATIGSGGTTASLNSNGTLTLRTGGANANAITDATAWFRIGGDNTQNPNSFLTQRSDATTTFDLLRLKGMASMTGAVLDVQTSASTSVLKVTGDSKIGFFGATPVVQEAGGNDVLASLVTLGLRAASNNPPLNLGTGALTCGDISQTPTATGTVHWTLNAPSGQSANIVDVQLNGATKFKIGSGGGVTFSQSMAFADGIGIQLGTTTGSAIGLAANQKLAFHNATPVVQRAGAAQAAVATTAATNVTPYGFSQTQADGIVTLLNEIRAALVEKGLIKGSA